MRRREPCSCPRNDSARGRKLGLHKYDTYVLSHYILGVMVHWWRNRQVRGRVVIGRHSEEFVVGSRRQMTPVEC